MPFAFIKFVAPRGGEYPDQGLPGEPAYPDQGLPGAPPEVDNSLPGGGYPTTGPIYPPHLWPFPPRPWPPHPPRPWPPIPPPRPWPPIPWPPGPVDPDWGIDAGLAPGQPIYIPPGRIDNELPPVAGTKPLPDPPPGTIWPPIPGAPTGEKFAILVWIIGVGWRYMVVEVPPPTISGPTPSPTT